MSGMLDASADPHYTAVYAHNTHNTHDTQYAQYTKSLSILSNQNTLLKGATCVPTSNI